MLEYLDSQPDWEKPEILSALDEVSLWSAPFGLMLIDRIKIAANMTVLDIGFGTGFPILEIAQRLGNSAVVYGIDTREQAVERARQKIKLLNIKNVKLIVGDASATEFADDFFDLIVSNVGVNNFEKPEAVIKECFRVAKPGGRVALTTNPKGHMREFFRVFEDTLKTLNLHESLKKLQAHIDHRHTGEAICRMLEGAGFRNVREEKSSFHMRFLNGSAFLNHHLIRYGFLDAWKQIIPSEDLERVFSHLEKSLNDAASQQGELTLFIPIAYIEGEKPVSDQ